MSAAVEILRKAVQTSGKPYRGGKDYPGFTELAEDFYDQGRWTTYYLTAYRHDESGELVGVIEWRGSTEMQEDDEDVAFLAVEIDPTPRCRVKR